MSNSRRSETDLIRKAARLAQELNAVLEELTSRSEKPEGRSPSEAKTSFDQDQLRAEFENLRVSVENGEDTHSIVSHFIEANSKERLNAFIRANGLPIATKRSKVSVASQLVQLLRQSKAIGAPVKSLTEPS